MDTVEIFENLVSKLQTSVEGHPLARPVTVSVRNTAGQEVCFARIEGKNISRIRVKGDTPNQIIMTEEAFIKIVRNPSTSTVLSLAQHPDKLRLGADADFLAAKAFADRLGSLAFG